MDTAFETGAYPSMTTDRLRFMIGAKRGGLQAERELARRIAVDAGDASQATDGEKLHGRVGRRIYEENGGVI